MFLYDAVANAMPVMVALWDSGFYGPEFQSFLRTAFPSPFHKES